MIQINDINSNDMLIFLQSQGMINLDDVRNKMKETERQRLLSQHKYKIFQDKDGRWKTTILDPSKKQEGG